MTVDLWDVLLVLFLLCCAGVVRLLLWAWGRLDQILAAERLRGEDQ